MNSMNVMNDAIESIGNKAGQREGWIMQRT